MSAAEKKQVLSLSSSLFRFYTMENKECNRRKFLKSSILGVGSLLVTSSLPSFSRNVSSKTVEELGFFDTNLLSREAKELFYKKQFQKSSLIYKRLISKFPQQITYYDGLARVYGAEQNNLAIVNLYREGLLHNPDNPFFMQRLSLRIKSICLGDKYAENVFQAKYDLPLPEVSVQLLFQAIEINPKNKGLYLSLLDFLADVDKYNKTFLNTSLTPINISNNLKNNIYSLTNDYKSEWEKNRKSTKTATVKDIESHLQEIKNRPRRKMYFESERKELNQNLLKEQKKILTVGLVCGLKNKNTQDVEKYGLLILNGDSRETNTISILRKNFKKTQNYNRLIALNRLVYSKNETPERALTLACSLLDYSNSKSDIVEAGSLLRNIKTEIPYLATIHQVQYYQCLAKKSIRENCHAEARSALLEGLEKYKGNKGLSYSFLELYALSYSGKEYEIGIDILELLSGSKEIDTIQQMKIADDAVCEYIKRYSTFIEKKELSEEDILRPSFAIAKLRDSAFLA